MALAVAMRPNARTKTSSETPVTLVELKAEPEDIEAVFSIFLQR
jgi:hypothetical protein